MWDALQAAGVARFPFPPHGRIPNFRAPSRPPSACSPTRCSPMPAASRSTPMRRSARCAPPPWRAASSSTSPRRACAAASGASIRPRFRPRRSPTPPVCRAAAAGARPVALRDLPRLDAIVAGSVAVTRDGRRCGKGEGYSDLEFAILRELGHPPVPVATTVHALQIVGDFPRDSNDLPLSLIVTAGRDDHREAPAAGPCRHRVGSPDARTDLDAMPVLRELRRLKRARAREIVKREASRRLPQPRCSRRGGATAWGTLHASR